MFISNVFDSLSMIKGQWTQRPDHILYPLPHLLQTYLLYPSKRTVKHSLATPPIKSNTVLPVARPYAGFPFPVCQQTMLLWV